MAAHDQWIPFYIPLYLADTGHLTTLQHGAYLLMLFHFMRSRKAIPDDPKLLAQVARMSLVEWSQICETVLSFWTKTPDGWIQKRALVEIERSERVYKNRVRSVSEINKKRKKVARSPSRNRGQSRNDDRNDTVDNSANSIGNSTGTTTTPSYGRGSTEPHPSRDAPGQPSSPHGAADRTSPSTEPEEVTATMPSGVKIGIDANGVINELWAPRDADPVSMTKKAAMEIRSAVIDGRDPFPGEQGAEQPSPATTDDGVGLPFHLDRKNWIDGKPPMVTA